MVKMNIEDFTGLTYTLPKIKIWNNNFKIYLQIASLIITPKKNFIVFTSYFSNTSLLPNDWK